MYLLYINTRYLYIINPLKCWIISVVYIYVNIYINNINNEQLYIYKPKVKTSESRAAARDSIGLFPWIYIYPIVFPSYILYSLRKRQNLGFVGLRPPNPSICSVFLPI